MTSISGFTWVPVARACSAAASASASAVRCCAIGVNLRGSDHIGKHLGRAAAGQGVDFAGVGVLGDVAGDDERDVGFPASGEFDVGGRCVGAWTKHGLTGVHGAPVRGMHG